MEKETLKSVYFSGSKSKISVMKKEVLVTELKDLLENFRADEPSIHYNLQVNNFLNLWDGDIDILKQMIFKMHFYDRSLFMRYLSGRKTLLTSELSGFISDFYNLVFDLDKKHVESTDILDNWRLKLALEECGDIEEPKHKEEIFERYKLRDYQRKEFYHY